MTITSRTTISISEKNSMRNKQIEMIVFFDRPAYNRHDADNCIQESMGVRWNWYWEILGENLINDQNGITINIMPRTKVKLLRKQFGWVVELRSNQVDTSNNILWWLLLFFVAWSIAILSTLIADWYSKILGPCFDTLFLRAKTSL